MSLAREKSEQVSRAPGAKHRAGPTVADVMTQVVVTVTPETPIREAVDLLVRRHISGAPIVSTSGQLLGLVSMTDVLGAQSSAPRARNTAFYMEDELSERMIATERPTDRRTVMDIATRKVVSIDEDAPLAKAAQILLELGIRRLLVTRRGNLAGILSATDVLKWVARPALGPEMSVPDVLA